MGRYRLILSLATIALSVLLFPAAAVAVPYPAPSPALTVSSGTVTEGNAVQISGTGFGVHEVVMLDVSYGGASQSAGSANTNGVGAFSTWVRLTQAGTAVITATGVTSGASMSVTVTVLAAGPSLPVTGDSASVLLTEVTGGTIAVLFGAALIWFAMRYRRSTRRKTAT